LNRRTIIANREKKVIDEDSHCWFKDWFFPSIIMDELHMNCCRLSLDLISPTILSNCGDTITIKNQNDIWKAGE
jgi:hypothetical protein